MSNETRIGAPLTATVGERLEERAHEGDTAGAERAAALVEDLHAGGYAAEPGAGRGRDEGEGATPEASGAARAGGARAGRADARSPVVWGVAAGLGAWFVAGMIGRAFRR